MQSSNDNQNTPLDSSDNTSPVQPPVKTAASQSSVQSKSNLFEKFKKLYIGTKLSIIGGVLWLVFTPLVFSLNKLFPYYQADGTINSLGGVGFFLIDVISKVGTIGLYLTIAGVILIFIRFVRNIDKNLPNQSINNATTLANSQNTGITPKVNSPIGQTKYPRKKLYLAMGFVSLVAGPFIFYLVGILIWGFILGDSPSSKAINISKPFVNLNFAFFVFLSGLGNILIAVALNQYYILYLQNLRTAQASADRLAISIAAHRMSKFLRTLAILLILFPNILAFLNFLLMTTLNNYGFIYVILINLLFIAFGVYIFMRSRSYDRIARQNSV